MLASLMLSWTQIHGLRRTNTTSEFKTFTFQDYTLALQQELLPKDKAMMAQKTLTILFEMGDKV